MAEEHKYKRKQSDGRPRMPTKFRRCVGIHARVTLAEMDAIKEMTENAGMRSVSEFIVAACFSFAGKSLRGLKKYEDERLAIKDEVQKKVLAEERKRGEPTDGTMGLL